MDPDGKRLATQPVSGKRTGAGVGLLGRTDLQSAADGASELGASAVNRPLRVAGRRLPPWAPKAGVATKRSTVGDSGWSKTEPAHRSPGAKPISKMSWLKKQFLQQPD